MANTSDINSTLRAKIAKLSSERELLDVDLNTESKKVKTDFAIEVVDILRSIISESDDGDLDTLQANAARLVELESYIQQANLSKKETATLSNAVQLVKGYLSKKIKNKTSILNSATNIVKDWTSNAGSMVENVMGTAFANDPLIDLATKGVTRVGGFLKDVVGKAISKRTNKNSVTDAGIKQDAASLLGKKVRVQRAPKGPGPIPEPENTVPPFSTQDFIRPNVPGANPQFGNTNAETNTILRTISVDVQSILSSLDTSQSMMQNLIEDLNLQNEEDRRERQAPKNTEEKVTKEGSKGGIFSKLFGMLSSGGIRGVLTAILRSGASRLIGAATGLLGIATNPVTLIAGGIIWSVIEGIKGSLKSNEWGVSKVSGAIGAVLAGTGKGIMNAFATAGRYALLGAGIGFLAGGPFGAIAGGIIGAIIGGFLGYIGGEKIAQVADDLGVWISNTFTNGLVTIKNFFLDMWGNVQEMFLNIGDAVDVIKLSMLDWLNGQIIKIMQADPTGMAVKALNPIAQTLNEKKDVIIETIEERKKARNDIEAQKQKRVVKFQDRIDKQMLDREDTLERRARKEAGEEEKPLDIVLKNDPAAIPPTNIQPKVSRRVDAKQNKEILLNALDKAGITDPVERAAFMAQTGHESMGYRTLTELGNSAYFKNYDGRTDIGNVMPGDGEKFKGRGFMQITGRDNYTRLGKKYNIDLVNRPELAAEPEIAATLAIDYWKNNVRPKVKDFADTTKITRLVNGGKNGLRDREDRFALALQDPSIQAPIVQASLAAESKISKMGKSVSELSNQQAIERNGVPSNFGQTINNFNQTSVNSASTQAPRQSGVGGAPQPDGRGTSVMASIQ